MLLDTRSRCQKATGSCQSVGFFLPSGYVSDGYSDCLERLMKVSCGKHPLPDDFGAPQRPSNTRPAVRRACVSEKKVYDMLGIETWTKMLPSDALRNTVERLSTIHRLNNVTASTNSDCPYKSSTDERCREHIRTKLLREF